MTHAAPPQPPLAPPGPPMSSGKAKRPFYKRKLVWLLGIVVLIIVIIAVNSSKSSTTAPAATDSGSSAPAAAPEAAAAEPGVGTSVRDGEFEFVVTSVEPGTPSIGGSSSDDEDSGPVRARQPQCYQHRHPGAEYSKPVEPS